MLIIRRSVLSGLVVGSSLAACAGGTAEKEPVPPAQPSMTDRTPQPSGEGSARLLLPDGRALESTPKPGMTRPVGTTDPEETRHPPTALVQKSPVPLASAQLPPPGNRELQQVGRDLYEHDGSLRPQTEQRPTTDSAWFEQLGRTLFSAIVDNDLERALPLFFPRDAYGVVKAIGHPEQDWERRLVRLLKRDLATYHRRLGKYRTEASFRRIALNQASVKWVTPGQEGNKLGYYRAVRNRLIYLDHQGRERELLITAFISWRGEWHLVHLNGVR